MDYEEEVNMNYIDYFSRVDFLLKEYMLLFPDVQFFTMHHSKVPDNFTGKCVYLLSVNPYGDSFQFMDINFKDGEITSEYEVKQFNKIKVSQFTQRRYRPIKDAL